jgi:protein TonB
LDKIALDHIRRAAPFPAPPEGADRTYSTEFVGK